MRHYKKLIFCALFFLVFATTALASTEGPGADLVEKTSLLILQLGVILFAAWIGRVIFFRLNIPVVLGEITAGFLIGPYCLGKLHFIGFEHGLFPLGEHFPVSVELYGIATIASIILLFIVGLETDINSFIRYAFTGSVVGTFGVIFSFITGDFLGVLMAPPVLGVHYGFFHPIPLFLGVISTATSVGLTARILSDKRKMNSPEGVTILSAAVVDDVLGIIILAIVLGMSNQDQIGWQEISMIALKAFGIWLGFTILGLKYARKLSAVIKKVEDNTTITIICFGLALLLAGLFEKSGLAMIIGAYIMGLSLSKTDLSFIIQEQLDVLQHFFVPVFFCVMGMLIDPQKMASTQILAFGGLFILLAILGKVIGCSLPALFLNFNLRGALRIGVGMVPRGEVALIIAGIGLATGLISDEIFSVAMIMTFGTTLFTPPILDKMLAVHKPVLRKEEIHKNENKTIIFNMPNMETSELLLIKIVGAFENEGFFVHRMGLRQKIYQIRKGDVFISLKQTSENMTFDCEEKDTAFIHTVFYEVIAELEHVMQHLETFTDKKLIGKKIFENKDVDAPQTFKAFQHLNPTAVRVKLKARTKQEVLEELIDILIQSNELDVSQRDMILTELNNRETTMSTGMQNGIALPHVKTDAIDTMIMAAGVCHQGIDFDSLDNKPSCIFVLTLASKRKPHAYLQSMAEISKILSNEKKVQQILSCQTDEELFLALKAGD